MLTGDNATTARSVAGELGIDELHADVSPALAAADIGIAMGGGTDVAMESAELTLVKGQLGAIVRARKLSQATERNPPESNFALASAIITP